MNSRNFEFEAFIDQLGVQVTAETWHIGHLEKEIDSNGFEKKKTEVCRNALTVELTVFRIHATKLLQKQMNYILNWYEGISRINNEVKRVM